MPRTDSDFDAVTGAIIAAAIDVHDDKGPGLLESIYDWSLQCELTLRGLPFETQRTVEVSYKSFRRTEALRFDLLVEGCVMVEVKAVEKVLPIHQAQLYSYMKLLGVPVGLLLNFHAYRMRNGIVRLDLGRRSAGDVTPAVRP